MQNKSHYSGFTLVETMSVIAIGGLMATQQIIQKVDEMRTEAGQNLGKDIAGLARALDQRFYIDGKNIAQWQSSLSWSGAAQFRTRFLRDALAGDQVPTSTCRGRWAVTSLPNSPLRTQNRMGTLWPCAKWSVMPFNLEVRGNVQQASGKITNIVNIFYYPSRAAWMTSTQNDNYGTAAPHGNRDIITAYEAAKVAGKSDTTTLVVDLVDNRNLNIINKLTCANLKEYCAIKVEQKSGATNLDGEYLNIHGKNQMNAEIKFADANGNIKGNCYRNTLNGLGQVTGRARVRCAIENNPGNINDTPDANLGDVTGQNMSADTLGVRGNSYTQGTDTTAGLKDNRSTVYNRGNSYTWGWDTSYGVKDNRNTVYNRRDSNTYGTDYSWGLKDNRSTVYNRGNEYGWGWDVSYGVRYTAGTNYLHNIYNSGWNWGNRGYGSAYHGYIGRDSTSWRWLYNKRASYIRDPREIATKEYVDTYGGGNFLVMGIYQVRRGTTISKPNCRRGGTGYARIVLSPVSFMTFADSSVVNLNYTQHASGWYNSYWRIHFYSTGRGGWRKNGNGSSIATIYCRNY